MFGAASSRLRAALTGVALVAAALAGCAPAVPPPSVPLTEQVRVRDGALSGLLDPAPRDDLAAGAVLRWRGIPYAAPPVGPRRWAPPADAAPWDGVRPATRSGPGCPRPSPPAAPTVLGAEDCLHLDVTVPVGTRTDAGLPVLVWLPADGTTSAPAAAAELDPRRLATTGPLVVVTVDHRIGALGFLALPGLPGAGAFGLLDQQAALRWVRENIAAFGGDPEAVTVAGQGSGADHACAHLASPASGGLLDRAILQSGGCGSANLGDTVTPGTGPAGDAWQPRTLVESLSAATARRAGCAPPVPDATAGSSPLPQVLACLRTRPVDTVVAAAAGQRWGPATGTPTVPRRPSDLLDDRDLRAVPVLSGTVRDEGVTFVGAPDRPGPRTEAGLTTWLALIAGLRRDAATAAYPTAGRDPDRVWADVVTDRAFTCPALNTHRALAARAPVYAYEFAAPPPGTTDVPHGAELRLLFEPRAGDPPLDPGEQVLAGRLRTAWAQFASTGDPNRPGPADTGPSPWPEFGSSSAVSILGGPDDGRTTPTAAFAAAHRCSVWP